MLEPSISRWIRADHGAILVVTVWAVIATHGSWPWFFALFLVPDLSAIGYLFGPRAGAITYNAGHLYAWPVALLAAGFTWPAPTVTTAALSWIAHIALDNVAGYGLKLPIGFEHTAYGPIGRARARAAASAEADARTTPHPRIDRTSGRPRETRQQSENRTSRGTPAMPGSAD